MLTLEQMEHAIRNLLDEWKSNGWIESVHVVDGRASIKFSPTGLSQLRIVRENLAGLKETMTEADAYAVEWLTRTDSDSSEN
jgi:hypothetical protein